MRTPRFWTSKNWQSTVLLPAAALYGFGAWVDRRLTTPQRASVPVISIGNATSGGAGKTPTALALVPLLQQLGQAPHIVSRGYGGRPLEAHRVASSDDWQQVGDEPLLLAQAAPTWVGGNRIASACAAHAAGASIVLADDALQHHALHKDISLLVIDGIFGIGNGRLIPAGPLREPFTAALQRADAVVLIGEDRHQITTHISKPIFRANFASKGDVAWAKNATLLAFAGIAYPQKFYDSLQQMGGTIVEQIDFPDHHPYARAEIEKLLQRAAFLGAKLVTTSKDAIKIPTDLQEQLHVLEVTLQWNDEATLLQWLRAALAQQK